MIKEIVEYTADDELIERVIKTSSGDIVEKDNNLTDSNKIDTTDFKIFIENFILYIEQYNEDIKEYMLTQTSDFYRNNTKKQLINWWAKTRNSYFEYKNKIAIGKLVNDTKPSSENLLLEANIRVLNDIEVKLAAYKMVIYELLLADNEECFFADNEECFF